MLEANNASSSSSQTAGSKPIIDLSPAIAQSRQTDQLFNINHTLSAEAHKQESQEIAYKLSRNSSKLSSVVLKGLEDQTSYQQKVVATFSAHIPEGNPIIGKISHQVTFVEDFHEKKTVQSDFFEIASSCKETEYSLNP